MRPSRRSAKILITLTLLFIIALSPYPTHGQNDQPTEQNREVPGLDVIILVDESETMWNKTDTEGVRINTVDFFIDMLTAEQSGAGHRAAIIAFGTEPYIIPYTLLDSSEAAASLKEQFAAIHKQIEATKDAQFTDINKALQAALTLLEQERDATRKPAVILISDGQPTNPTVSEKRGRDTVEAYLAETQGLLEQLGQHSYQGEVCSSLNGVPLYTIGMGIDKLAEASTPEFITLYREFWQGVASRTNGYYREAGRLQEMQGISTYIFSELLCTPATPSLTLRTTQLLEYQVYQSYYQIIFTISGKDNPDLKTQIYRPKQDGTAGEILLQQDDEGVNWQPGLDYEVWRIRYTEPWTGTWRVALDGEGQAEFSYVIFPNVALNIKEPNSGFLPVDKPFTLEATITDENGQLLEAPVDDFLVEIEGENFRRQVSLEREGESYVAQLDALEKTGEYSLIFSTLLPDGTPLFEHKFVTLISAPWAEVAEPKKGSSYLPEETIPVLANVHLAGAIPLDGIKMIAALLKDGEPVQTIELSRGDVLAQGEGENTVAYAGDFRPVEASGDYAVQAKLMAILPGGRVFDHQTPLIALSITAPPTATPSPTATATATPLPTQTPVAAAVVAASPIPPPPPEPAPPPVSLLASLSSLSYFPCLALLLLLLLLAGVGAGWYRRRQAVPDKIKLLAMLMRSRQENNELPYLLVLGSGPSMLLGSRSLRRVVEAIAGNPDLEGFHRTLDGFSAMERYLLLKKHFDEAELSPGYRRLAELIEKGYFKVILTTNLDPFVEMSLMNGNSASIAHEVLICGKHATTQMLEQFESTEPPVKIVKLHGDVQARSFAFTPSEVSAFGGDSEQILRRYLSYDLLIVGHGSRDYDINRAVELKGGSIWYINQHPPATDSTLYRVMRARRTESNVIDGDFGLFDRFFEALYKELMRS